MLLTWDAVEQSLLGQSWASALHTADIEPSRQRTWVMDRRELEVQARVYFATSASCGLHPLCCREHGKRVFGLRNVFQ